MDRGRVALVVVMLLATAGLVAWYRSADADDVGVGGLVDPSAVDRGATRTTTTIVRRHDPDDLGVVLDPDGRPYDATTRDTDRTIRLETEVITSMRLPGGEVRTMSGETVPWAGDAWDEGVASTLDTDRVTVTMIWETWEQDGERVRGPLGLRLDAPGAAVSRWGPLEFAYGTDGGMGGVASSTWPAAVEELPDDDREALLDRFVEDTLDYELFDLDGRDGTDALVFGNGWGDGGFPKATGYSSDGDAVSLVIWRTDHPWRLAFPEGTPPPEITEREDQLQECLDGERGVDEHGWCVADGEPW